MFHFDEGPIAQAQYFLEVASPVPGDLPPALDLERGNSKSADGAVEAVLLFLNALRRVVKEPAVIYVGHDFWANSLGATTELADNPLWFPHYADTPTPSGVPAPWPKWTFWQHSQNAAVDGITPPVDLDWFNGDEVALLQFALGGNPDGK